MDRPRVTMATAIVSAFHGPREAMAMTGEITLTGRVLPIGGLKEKVLGAYRAGIREIILPADNEAHLDDLPKELRGKMKYNLVRDLGEVLALALRGASLEKGNIVFATAPNVPLGKTVP
jgi:ATP-dependent Lon protease